jgi:hypothetical protein
MYCVNKLLQEQREQIRHLQAELMQARAKVIIQVSRIAYLQNDLHNLKVVPDRDSSNSLRQWWCSHFSYGEVAADLPGSRGMLI